MKKTGIGVTEENAKKYFAKYNVSSGELADEELDNVAGGGCHKDDGRLIVITVFMSLHFCCVTTMHVEVKVFSIFYNHILQEFGSKGCSVALRK